MREMMLFLAGLSLFLLVPASITRAQTISSQKGLTTAEFNLSQGKVKVFIPDDIRPGESFSGTVLVEPIGRNAKQIESNRKELLGQSLSFNGKKVNLENANQQFQISLPAGQTGDNRIGLSSVNGKNQQSATIPSKAAGQQDPVRGNCVLPSHALTGSPNSIKGNFDGNSQNTTGRLNGSPLTILAESFSQSIVFYPASAAGIQNMMMQESGKPECSGNVSGVTLAARTGKKTLVSGEQTTLEITITGIANLPGLATLRVNNLSATTVSLLPSNTIIIPLPADSVSSGNFNRSFTIQGLRSGDFTMAVDLDLPEQANYPPTQPQPNQPDQPNQQQCPKCNCSCTASIITEGTKDGVITYSVELGGGCSGQWGSPPCQPCTTARTILWQVSFSADKPIEVIGGNGGTSFQFKNPHGGHYTVTVKVTDRCSDGTECTCRASISVGPPTIPEPEKGSCECDGSCEIRKAGMGPTHISFDAIVKAECKGYSGTGSTRVTCEVKDVEYRWHNHDNSVIDIGKAVNGKSLRAKILKAGSFSLNLTITIICSDGTRCERNCNLEGSIPPPWPGPATCAIDWLELPGPVITGTVKSKFLGAFPKKKRDDFIALGAEGSDEDQLQWTCIPDPKCAPGGSSIIPLNSRVRFEWQIMTGEGSFVKLGCLPENDFISLGDYAIFKPPVIPLPAIGAETSVKTLVHLRIIDDNPTQPQDATLIRAIEIVTKRSRNPKAGTDPTKEDYYDITITQDKTITPAGVVPVPSGESNCKPVGPKWTKASPIPASEILLPKEIPGHEIVLLGQWMLLSAKDSRDVDLVKDISCKPSSGNCIPPTPLENNYEDDVVFKWELVDTDFGKFGNDMVTDQGATVIFKSVEKWPSTVKTDFFDVRIRMKPVNPKGGDRHDPDAASVTKTIRVYKPGVKLSIVDKEWLPKSDNSIDLTSTLMRKDKDWVEAPPHACRIHFFELMEVSNEKGICMNAPLKDALSCRDLKLANTATLEAMYDTSKQTECDGKGYFMQARSLSPVKTETITVYSEDFGAYGFLRSFANLNFGGTDGMKDQLPVYVSIPVIEKEARHPSFTTGRGKFDHKDNRVSIPLDVDNNHIPDNGWTTGRKEKVKDPPWDYNDDDDKPPGDGENGDGLTNYEEYRGFMVDEILGAAVKVAAPAHTRTDIKTKSLFIHRVQDTLDVSLFEKISQLEICLINETQYNSEKIKGVDDPIYGKRWINFNYTNAKKVIEQWGLKLIDYGLNPDGNQKMHGIALNYRMEGKERPSPPNSEFEIRIFGHAVAASSREKGYDYKAKIRQVIAHELFHGCNICHHGEKAPDASSDVTYDSPEFGGLRSGDINCVMRYDNVGARKFAGYIPEEPGTVLCTSVAGTGYNTPDTTFNGKKIKAITQKGMGDAALNRGNCTDQLRISARKGLPPPCRQVETRKKIGDFKQP